MYFLRFSIGVYRWEAGAVACVHILLPESDRVIDPAFGHCACADTEAVCQAVVYVKFGGDAHFGEAAETILHYWPRCNAVVGAYARICRSVVGRGSGVAGVLDYFGGCAGDVGASGESLQIQAVGQYGTHASTGGTSPEGIVGWIDAQFGGVVVNVSDGFSKVGVRIIGAVDDGKGIVSGSAYLESMGKAVVHSSHVHESAAGIGDGEGAVFPATEKEKSCVGF